VIDIQIHIDIKRNYMCDVEVRAADNVRRGQRHSVLVPREVFCARNTEGKLYI